MDPRTLGSGGRQVSPIGLGTVKLGRNTGVKYPRGFDLPDDDAVEDLLEGALALGVSFFDTAPAYGNAESRLGAFVAQHRREIMLCTKAGETYEAGRSHYDFSANGVRTSLYRSLERLRTDRVDLLLLHSDGRDAEILAQGPAVEGLLALKEEGVVEATGISAKTGEGIEAATGLLDVVMAPYSWADPSLGPALARAHRRGTGVLAIKGLASGHARDKAKALSFVLEAEFVDSLVVGTLNLDHLRQAVDIATRAEPRRGGSNP